MKRLYFCDDGVRCSEHAHSSLGGVALRVTAKDQFLTAKNEGCALACKVCGHDPYGVAGKITEAYPNGVPIKEDK